MALLAAIAAFGLLIGVSALKTDQDRPETEAERAELIAQIQKRQDDQEALSRAINAVSDDVTELQSTVGDDVSRNTSIVARLETSASRPARWRCPARAWRSPPTTRRRTGPARRRHPRHRPAGLVNRLWIAGAEAIAIDGHRLTSLTAIRFAGEAITVDYVSLTPPYEVTAIGDPDTLPARLLETPGRPDLAGPPGELRDHVRPRDQGRRRVPADPHEHLLYAKQGGTR